MPGTVRRARHCVPRTRLGLGDRSTPHLSRLALESAFPASGSAGRSGTLRLVGAQGPARRAALAVLAQPCEHLFAQIESNRAAAVALAAARASIADYLAHLAAVVETMKAAELRLTLGLCVRDDMEEVIAEAA